MVPVSTTVTTRPRKAAPNSAAQVATKALLLMGVCALASLGRAHYIPAAGIYGDEKRSQAMEEALEVVGNGSGGLGGLGGGNNRFYQEPGLAAAQNLAPCDGPCMLSLHTCVRCLRASRLFRQVVGREALL